MPPERDTTKVRINSCLLPSPAHEAFKSVSETSIALKTKRGGMRWKKARSSIDIGTESNTGLEGAASVCTASASLIAASHGVHWDSKVWGPRPMRLDPEAIAAPLEAFLNLPPPRPKLAAMAPLEGTGGFPQTSGAASPLPLGPSTVAVLSVKPATHLKVARLLGDCIMGLRPPLEGGGGARCRGVLIRYAVGGNLGRLWSLAALMKQLAVMQQAGEVDQEVQESVCIMAGFLLSDSYSPRVQ